MQKSNVILISIDTLRADEVGCINPASDLTPNINRLAEEGIVFKRCFSQGPGTRASFPSILSSTYPLMFRDYHDWGIRERLSIAELLKKDGYSTAAFHSNPYLTRGYGYDKGFDVFYEGITKKTTAQSFRDKLQTKLGIKNYRKVEWVYIKIKKLLRPVMKIKVSPEMPYIDGKVMLDLSKKYLDQVRDRFFVWIHFMDVHMPYPGGDDDISSKIFRHARGEYEFSEHEINDVKRLRDERIRYVDQKVGELISYLKEKGIYDKTYIFICSDHGEEFFEHGNLGHSNKLYDELIHVPLVTNYEKGDVEGIRGNIDIPVTLLGIAGIPIPDIFMGLPFNEKRDFVFAEASDPIIKQNQICVRTEKNKLIYNLTTNKIQLYDLVEDSKENNNLADSRPAEVAKLMEIIEKHMQQKKKIERKTLLYRVKMKKFGKKTQSAE